MPLKGFCGALILTTAGFAVAAESLQFTFDFSPADVALTQEGEYVRVDLKQAGLSADDLAGRPWLPSRNINVLLPQNARDAQVAAVSDEILVATNILVLPAQPPQPLSLPASSFVLPDLAVYQRDAVFPQESAVAAAHQTIRGNTFLPVRLNPVRYNPAQGRLYLAKRIVLTVEYGNARAAGANYSLLPQADMFDEITRGLVINPEHLSAVVPTRKTGDRPAGAVDYLVITDSTISNAFQRLANHRKIRENLNVRILTTNYIADTFPGLRPDGGSDLQTKIRNCIKSFVTDFGVTYVVLGGDDSIVPKRGCHVTCSGYTEDSMPTDLYYGGLDGTWDGNANGVYGETDDSVDLACDVIVARIPVRTAAQAADYINKLIRFETAPAPANFAKKLFIGGCALWNSYSGDSRPSDLVGDGLSEFKSHSPVSDAEIWGRRSWRDGIKPYNPAMLLSQFHDTLTSWDGGTPGDYLQNSANMMLRFNQGWNQVMLNTHGNYTIWGLESGSFGTAAAAGLTNYTAVVYTMACLTGGFDGAEPCLSEAFLRNPNGGALAYIGCSRYGWGSPGSAQGGPSIEYAYAFCNQLYNLKRSHAGIAFAEHKLSKIGQSSYDGAYRWIQFGLNLQGEPLTPLFRPDTWLGKDAFWFRAVALTNSVMMRWPDPNSCGYTSRVAHIRSHTNHFPANLSEGSKVYQGSEQFYEHTGLVPGRPYYYTIWLSNDGEHFIEP